MKDANTDPIESSVQKQLETFALLGARTFKVQCVPDADLRGQPKLMGKGILQPWKPWRWTSRDVLRNLSMLKRRNLEGFNIFIAPLPDVANTYAPLVFVDDILPKALAKMRSDGLELAVLIESSPSKFQGWLSVNAPSLLAADIIHIQRQLVGRYGLDIGAIGAEQNGRLAGFRNVKAKYLDQRIFSKLVRAEPRKTNLELMSEVRSSPEQECSAFIPNRSTSKSGSRIRAEISHSRSSIEAFWLRKISAVSKPSESEREFSACLACLRNGFDVAEVEQTLFQLGNDLVKRKGSETAVWDYVRRTVGKAANIIAGG